MQAKTRTRNLNFRKRKRTGTNASHRHAKTYAANIKRRKTIRGDIAEIGGPLPMTTLATASSSPKVGDGHDEGWPCVANRPPCFKDSVELGEPTIPSACPISVRLAQNVLRTNPRLAAKLQIPASGN